MEKFTLELQFQIAGIGSSSGLIYKDNSLYIISDNSSFLYQYRIQEKELNKIKLFDNGQENIAKKEKYDFESITLKGNKLYLFGSGSTPNRNRRITFHLENRKVEEKDLSSLYDKLKQTAYISDDDLNIEGALFHNEKWHMFQRGNGAQSKNGLFTLDKKGNDIHFFPISLPKIQNIEATFTDAILVEDKIYFLAAVENTTLTYDDGEVLGSFIGALSLENFEVLITQKISDIHKFEGLTLYAKTEQKIDFLLCEDKDTEALETDIYKLSVDLK
ncbi:hypothetical protein H4V97_002729 [Flavobacterium sp. CG_23.5]|uniref:DUF6929 family protein n=1 Tax=unclassified Flavobacterium TaxID=196869 RepID=UPI0018C9CBCE|nr:MULTISPECIES: hypothetical protein [unclassified Flavobacterium]MBG6111206.1 hypothetical protein [Flavobacterium sp. CG_9.10]MBP2284411.1 hypothetical protein [Flavobacterium sp. CG_23.5]